MIKLDLEAKLDRRIQFNAPLSEHAKKPTSIFLTGATGFLGAYLLKDLLKQTTAQIYCLVRCQNEEDGKKRIQQNLQNYKLWQPSFNQRIIPIRGDISKPNLALTQTTFLQLANTIDVIYHAAAKVNLFMSYQDLKAINVLGTQEILRLAGLIQLKPLHFISTTSVYLSAKHPSGSVVTEADKPELDETMKGGYKQSKWVAERMVSEARQRGLSVSIYRAGRISNDSQTGIIHNSEDVLSRLLKCCIELKQIPKLEVKVNLVPVDYIAKGVVLLSQQTDCLGECFHFFHRQPKAWLSLFDDIKTLGYSLETVTLKDWLQELENRGNSESNKIYKSILLFMNAPNNLVAKKPIFNVEKTEAKLKTLGLICPEIDKQLLKTYVSFFQQTGYLPYP